MHFGKTVFFIIFVDLVMGEIPCPEVLSRDISSGIRDRDGNSIRHNGVVYSRKDYYVENGTLFGCVCNVAKCARKCCPLGEKMTGGGTCEPTDDTQFQVQIFDGLKPLHRNGRFEYIFNSNCSHGRTLLFPNFNDSTKSDNFFLQENGDLYVPFIESKRTLYSPDKYCIDIFFLEDLNDELSVLLCFDSEDSEDTEEVAKVGMLISIPFLLATFLAYALLPDRNLHMKALMFYVINLMLSYIILVVIQLTDSRFEATVCKLMGYFCLFFFLVSFFWMNVICVDIWFAFSGLRGFSGSKQTAERKRFLMYCGYACGVPVLHILIVYAIDALADQKSWYHPGIGIQQCFLKSGYPELLYFHGPMAILITMNIVLFAITAFKIRSIKKDTSMLKKEDSKRHSYENDKQTFNLYLKLLFAMGVNWSMEIISWAVNWAGKAPDAIWYLTDFCNAIYGVFIFFIFVFKKNIWKLLKKRYYAFRGRSHLAHSMTMSHTARTTSYSTANTSISENPHTVTDTTNLTNEP